MDNYDVSRFFRNANISKEDFIHPIRAKLCTLIRVFH